MVWLSASIGRSPCFEQHEARADRLRLPSCGCAKALLWVDTIWRDRDAACGDRERTAGALFQEPAHRGTTR